MGVRMKFMGVRIKFRGTQVEKPWFRGTMTIQDN